MDIRNVAIIAHVDHGKTTLVDALLRQSKTHLSKEAAASDLIMDSNELERERGITIFSKSASVVWKDVKINIVDTPGHADFGGEVERVLRMVDGCLLLVDAKEGPMPQTRFVLKKALEMGLRIVVVINKIDKPDARPDYVLDKTFDLFVELGADDALLDFPVVYASAKDGIAGTTPVLADMHSITPVFDEILTHIPAPTGDVNAPLQFLVTNIARDEYKGRIATGRVVNGVLRQNKAVLHCQRDGTQKKAALTSIMTFEGLARIDVPEAQAGDIASIAGIADVTIGETLTDVENPQPLPVLDIEEPTVKMTLMVNDSPFAGKEGQFSTSRQINERLMKELESDMALQVIANSDGTWTVSGRGELHLAILVERMRREGYELQVSQPQVIAKEVGGKKQVPYEDVYVEVPEASSGIVIQKLGSRHGMLKNMFKEDNGIVLLEFHIPTRGLFGYRREFLTDTRGLGILNTSFEDYGDDFSDWHDRDQGSLVAHEAGETNLYGLLNVQDRGVLFLGPAVSVYRGQVVGQHSRTGDLHVNVCKAKQLSNMRSKGDGSADHFNTPQTMDLEDALEYIGADELVEVTPKTVRIRKRVLDPSAARKNELGIKN